MTELVRVPVGDPPFLAEMAHFLLQTYSGQKPGRELGGGLQVEAVLISGKSAADRERAMYMGGAHQTWCVGGLSR
jgi:hypothetical protein